MTVNGFSIESAAGGHVVRRSSGALAATCQTRAAAVALARRFIPEDEHGRPLERYVPASWWRRLFNPAAPGHWAEA
jgi:hypothetical protein